MTTPPRKHVPSLSDLTKNKQNDDAAKVQDPNTINTPKDVKNDKDTNKDNKFFDSDKNDKNDKNDKDDNKFFNKNDKNDKDLNKDDKDDNNLNKNDNDFDKDNEDDNDLVANPNDSSLNVIHRDGEQVVVKREREPFLSPHVVATVPNKTPNELSQETAEESANRYNVDQTISDVNLNDPRVQAYADDHLFQIPSSTHLHPDIAKDMYQRGISERTSDSAQVKRTITDVYDFAPDAEQNDKF